VFELARNTCFWRFQPRVEQAEYRRPGRIPRRVVLNGPGVIPRHPKHAIRFAGGTLLGYDEGESGGGTIFYREDAMAQILDTHEVHGFAGMPFGALILTHLHGWDRDNIYLAKKTEDGTVTVNVFVVLPSVGKRLWHLPSGDLRIACDGGDMIITTRGEIRMAAD